MRSVMEKWAVYSSPFYAFHYGLTAANPAYALTTTFLGMCTFNYRPSAFYYYADSSWPDFDDATYGQIITADASGVSSVLPMMSFDYKKVAPAVSSGTCQIELISSGNGSPYYKLVRETSDGTYTGLSLSEGTGNVDYTITVSSVGTAGTTKALTIVAANCSTITGDMTYHYSVDIN